MAKNREAHPCAPRLSASRPHSNSKSITSTPKEGMSAAANDFILIHQLAYLHHNSLLILVFVCQQYNYGLALT